MADEEKTPEEEPETASASEAPPTPESETEAASDASASEADAPSGSEPATAAEPLSARREKHPGRQKTRQGVVVSDKATKTIVVRIDVTRRHPFYEKVVRTSTTLHAHDEREDAHIGDTVMVRESRPLSRTKRWRLVEVLQRAK